MAEKITSQLIIDYDPLEKEVVFRVSPEDSRSVWFQQIYRALQDHTENVRMIESGVLRAPWWSFLAIRQGIGAILINAEVVYDVAEIAKRLLQKSASSQQTLKTAATIAPLSQEEIKQKLIEAGWLWESRSLTAEQMRNVSRLSTLPAGATFSVPGAGKTTEALAYFFLKTNPDQRLLVVAPKNAFSAWEEQLEICMGTKVGTFERLRGGENIAELLVDKQPRFSLITYHQLARVPDIIANFISETGTFVYLDESHKIKAGKGRVTVDAVLTISHLPVNKLILTGTPMPQSNEDLIPQFNFLYPEVKASPENIIDLVRPIFVRTTKNELDIPNARRHIIPVPFNPVQKQLYDLMRYETAREAAKALTQRTRSSLKMLGRSVIRLIEVVSNPSLLVRDIQFLHADMLGEVLAEGAAPKIMFACERARRLAQKGKKSLIWTTFRGNVETIADQLRDLAAVYIHGGIDAGEDDDDDTREGRIKKFHEDPNCFVMVANPAAASEGISLHKVCHHAIYVDRTYNAAHYLQSEDRIHRLGLLPEEAPIIEILQCPGSIDESIQIRLEAKVARMANALNDPSLHIGADQYIPFDDDDDPENQVLDIDEEDVRSILDWLRREV